VCLVELPAPDTEAEQEKMTVHTSTNVITDMETLENGNTLISHIRIEKRIRSIVETVVTCEGVKRQTVREEVEGTDIYEDLTELPPGVTDLDTEALTLDREVTRDESEETAEDGSWIRRHTTLTTVKLPSNRPIAVSPEACEEYEEQLHDGSTVHRQERVSETERGISHTITTVYADGHTSQETLHEELSTPQSVPSPEHMPYLPCQSDDSAVSPEDARHDQLPLKVKVIDECE
jgi:hypothetical protein